MATPAADRRLPAGGEVAGDKDTTYTLGEASRTRLWIWLGDLWLGSSMATIMATTAAAGTAVRQQTDC